MPASAPVDNEPDELFGDVPEVVATGCGVVLAVFEAGSEARIAAEGGWNNDRSEEARTTVRADWYAYWF